MATVNYSQPVINARLTDVITAIDAGGGPGVCLLADGLGVLVSTLTLPLPSGSAAGGVLTFNTPWVDPAAVGGTPSRAKIQNSVGTDIITGLTVGAGSSSFDIVLSGATILAGQTVTINAALIIGR